MIIKMLLIMILVINVSTVYADICGSKELARWDGPEVRTKCSKYAKGDFPFGGGWKTCTSWSNDMKKHSVSIVAICSDDSDKILNETANNCILKSIAITFPSVSFNQDAYYLLNEKSNNINIEFKACMLEQGVDKSDIEKYSIKVLNKSLWN